MELASKLSYFLWNSPPDDELLRLAATDKLTEQLDQQIDRMIDDPKFRRFVEPFGAQWLSLDKLDAVEVRCEAFSKTHKGREAGTQKRTGPVSGIPDPK